MSEETILLTRELIDGLKRNGSYTTATIEALGLSWKTIGGRGWTRRLVGKRIKTSDYDKAFAGREVLARDHRRNKMARAADNPELQAYYAKVAAEEYPVAPPTQHELMRDMLTEIREMRAVLDKYVNR